MSTTDTIRAAFEAAYLSANGFHTKAELANEWKDGMLSSHMFRAGYQAATEAAKATGTALQPMTMSYVQNIPDQCDRITWRGAYYHLKEGAEAARQPAPVIEKKFSDTIKPILVPEDFGILDPELAKRAVNFANAMAHQAALAETAAPVLMPEGVTIKAFQAAHDKAWHITIKHPFGESSMRMSNQRDIQLAELIAATNRSQP